MRESWLAQFRDSGDLYLPVGVRRILETYIIGSKTSLFYITFWSILHFVSGVACSLVFRTLLGWSVPKTALVALCIHSMWELWQFLITKTPRTMRGYIDTGVDTALFMAGVFAG